MNLITETKTKLQGNINRLEDLEECLKSNLTRDAVHYCNEEIAKAKVNIEYYSKILEVLERK